MYLVYTVAAMENHSKRMAHGDPRPARAPSSREQRSSFVRAFHEAVVLVTYVTEFYRVGRVVVYTPHGERPPAIFNFQAQAS